MIKKLAGLLFVVCALVLVQGQSVSAQEAVTTSADVTTQMELLQSLMAQIQELQKKLAALQAEAGVVQQQLRANLAEGASGDDVRKIQELLASDPTLYPEGLTTGYFGSLTKEAVKRFQLRHELAPTGLMDEDTKAMLEAYLADAGKTTIPPGFLKAPGIQQKIEKRFVENCEKQGRGNASFCNKVKMKLPDHVKDKVKDKGSDSDDVKHTGGDAAEAIEDAEEAIADLEEVIAETDATDEEIATAEAALAAAEAKLELARERFAADDNDAAEDLAEIAEKMADDAREALTGDEDDDDN